MRSNKIIRKKKNIVLIFLFLLTFLFSTYILFPFCVETFFNLYNKRVKKVSQISKYLKKIYLKINWKNYYSKPLIYINSSNFNFYKYLNLNNGNKLINSKNNIESRNKPDRKNINPDNQISYYININNLKKIIKSNFYPEKFDNVVLLSQRNSYFYEMYQFDFKAVNCDKLIQDKNPEIKKIKYSKNSICKNIIKVHFISLDYKSTEKLFNRIKRAYLERKCIYIFLSENISSSFYKKIYNLKRFPLFYNYRTNKIFSLILILYFLQNLIFSIKKNSGNNKYINFFKFYSINRKKQKEKRKTWIIKINIVHFYLKVLFLTVLLNLFFAIFPNNNNYSNLLFKRLYILSFFHSISYYLILFFLFFYPLYNYVLFSFKKISFKNFMILLFLTGFAIHFYPQSNIYSYMFLKNHFVIFFYFSPFLTLILISIFSIYSEEKSQISDLLFKKLKKINIYKKEIIYIFVTFLLFLFFILRMFVNKPFLFEMKIRDFLEHVFFIRPRFKEIIFYPFLYFFVFKGNKISDKNLNYKKNYYYIISGYFPIISYLNSSYHYHTPFYLTLYRSLIPFLFYLVIAATISWFAKAKYFKRSV